MSSFALQQAIYSVLAANTDLQALIGNPPRLFDFVPRDCDFPYVVIGDATESDWSTATEDGSEHQLTIHVWSRSTGHKEGKTIAGIIRAALSNAALSVSDATLIDIRHLATDSARQPDGQTYRASLRFRAVTEP
jgi:hypothetical protein